MSGSGRRRGSKWDMKEDISPENRCDIARSNKPGIPFRERESREYGSGRRGFQRDDRMNEESMLGWDGGGHYARRMSPGPDEQRRQSRSRSPRRNRATSYRSRSKSRSRSRSPAHNLQWEPSVHRSSGKSGHSAPLCRDFAAGRCKKGDHCRFGHHSSPNHDSRKQFESKTGDGWERRRGSDGGSRHHSDSYSSGGRSTNICNDFLKGRCTRGTSCKFRHYESGSDEFGKGGKDGSSRDGDNDWRNKRGSAYDQEAHISSEPVCKFFAAGNCRNGKHCKFSHQREGQFNAERRSPDGRQREHKLEGTNKGWNDPSWGERTSLRRVPEESGWGVQESDFRDPRKSKAGDWSKEELPNHQLDDPNYMRDAANRVNENVASHVNQFLQWESNDISVSEMKGIEKGFSDGKMLSPKSNFNSQIGHVGQLSDSLSFPKTSLPFGDQNTAQRASVEKHYLSGIIQPNISGDYPQPNSSFPVNTTPDARNSGIPHVNANISTKFSSAQGIHQINGGFGAQPISSEDNLGQSQPMFPLHQLGVESMQVSHHQPALDSNLAPVQSQTVFPSHNQNEGVQLPHTQPAIDPNPAHEAYGSNTGISQAASGVSLGQNSTLNEQLVQYSHLSATLVQLLEKREQLPQLYAAISQQTASVPPVTAASARPIQASEPKRQYDPISDSVETKLVENLIEQKSSALGASEIPSSNCYPSSLATGGMATGDQKLLTSGDELKAKDHQLNEKGPAENGKATGNKANETQETLDQGATDDMALDSGADDSKKAKDAKGIRPFKFALAEFVKELLKPTWKGGQMTKDVYKNIVKKVVDKVTDTIQVAHIPRTKEKIDQYLSLSKPKLSKLTQAYLEKYHRT